MPGVGETNGRWTWDGQQWAVLEPVTCPPVTPVPVTCPPPWYSPPQGFVTSVNGMTGDVIITDADIPPGPPGPPGPTAGGPWINVNTLSTVGPLVGDGVTYNYNIWQSIIRNMYKAGGLEFPVAVTVASGSPCIVTMNAHGLRPNQCFYFTISSGGVLPSGVDTVTPYFVTFANLTVNSFTFSAVNNYLGPTEGATVNTTGASSGTVSVVLAGRTWIDLFVPPGAYLTNVTTYRRQVFMVPNDLSKVRL